MTSVQKVLNAFQKEKLNLTKDFPAYTITPFFYDMIFQDDDFDHWYQYYVESLSFFSKANNDLHILEIGCGRGEMTRRLIKIASRVQGLDQSIYMLKLAHIKNPLPFPSAYHHHNIISYNDAFENTFDSVTAFNDTLNYITSTENMQKIFQNVHRYLKKGGLFYFDLSTEYNVIKNHKNSAFYNDAMRGILWKNVYDKKSSSITSQFNFLFYYASPKDLFGIIPEESLLELGLTDIDLLKNHLNAGKDDIFYLQFWETHYQHIYNQDNIIELLYEAGFRKCHVFGTFSHEPPSGKDISYHFFAIK